MSSDLSTRPRAKVGLLGWMAGTDTHDQLDERERYVMMEAYSVGFTVLLHLCFALAAAQVWIWGAPVRWASWWTMIVPALSVFAIVRWTARRGGVSPYSNRCMSRRDRLVRSMPAIALALVWAAGFLRSTRTNLDTSTAAGMVVGLLVGLGATVLVLTAIRWLGDRKRRAEQAAWEDDDDF